MTDLLAAVGLLLVLALVAYALVLRLLGRRVVAVTRTRKALQVRATEGKVILPRDELTEASGAYGLWYGEGFQEHAVIGEPISANAADVWRPILTATTALPDHPFLARLTGPTEVGPDSLKLPYREVSVPLQDGGSADAWLFPAAAPDVPWVIHVQGIRTSRLVTLRAVAAVQRAGLASLVITYRGAGDGPPRSASALGLSEWVDLRDAAAFARAQGAQAVVVIAWSMGAGLALELARREPRTIDSLVLICPAANWREIIRHGGRQAHLPRFVAEGAIALLGAPVLSRIVGLKEPIDFAALDWGHPGAVTVPTLVIHSRGDAEIPFELSQAFADAHPGMVTLAETRAAPHGWEANVDPAGFEAAIDSWLTRVRD